ncbi:hypothetical protein [Yersinia frederiksenii]|uniref:hypothetical protein n=1 Tax=Yersinia frederiksenii TaxID=29484 RepID=UPI000BFC6601|nr:hypothetical protein [Yersinia frederiksenii]ATM85086.1 hypothetical protein CRN74_02760 [Yersinia frederiksenii]
MIDPKLSLSEKKSELEKLVKLARQKVSQAETPKDNKRSSLERQMMEGDQEADEKAFDDLKTTVEGLTKAVEKIDTRSGELKNDLQEQLLEMRETYARKAYRFVWLWSVALIVILILQGAKYPVIKLWALEIRAFDFDLDPKVLIALISGVTVNIVAVFVVVMRNLFPSDSKEKDEKKKSKSKS